MVAELRHVAQQSDRSGDPVPGHQRVGPQHDHDPRSGREFGHRGAPSPERAPDDGVVESEVRQAAARHPTHHAQPMQSTAGIRRGVGDAALAVEHHHAIADAGLAELAHPLNPVVGEGAVRDHLGEPGIQTAVDGLQWVLVADGSRSRLAGQNRDRQVPTAHGHVVHHPETVAQRQAALLLHDCVVSDPGAVADLGDLALARLARRHRGAQPPAGRPPHHGADRIDGMDSGSRGRPRVGQHNEALAVPATCPTRRDPRPHRGVPCRNGINDRAPARA